MKLKKPKFWDYKEPNLYSYLLLPFSIILSLFSKIGSKPKSTNPEIKTICIGNIYIGGTGKTSLVMRIKEILATRYVHPDVNTQLKKIEKRATGKSRMGYHSMMAYPFRVKENFADGKKKGKSRPGRVKKSGASCNGSVTDLRARAKKASGEKAKMYHWCANMKGGKK